MNSILNKFLKSHKKLPKTEIDFKTGPRKRGKEREPSFLKGRIPHRIPI
jgi:hypothetical protein